MKKLLLILLLVLPLLLGQTVHYTDSVVVAWDEVTQLEDGTPVDPAAISYEVYYAPLGDKASLILAATVTALSATVTFPSEGDWLIGVRTVRTVGADQVYSEINWSDENGAATPDPFIVRFLKAPGAVSNLRVQ
jgi:hypothetical protein